MERQLKTEIVIRIDHFSHLTAQVPPAQQQNKSGVYCSEMANNHRIYALMNTT